ncbi:MAG: DNA-protecting protein DprA [Parcubacteria group bacterium]|nr:DNA-protecting protein DprA [Parcubacteria group bacterium]
MTAAEIQILAREQFPKALLEIPQVPERLYIKGALPSPLDYGYLAVVGSRKYTNYGREVCEKIIADLRGTPVVIVSGLALGIDAIAHNAALNAGLPTVAVPGSGLGAHVLYPRTNQRLAETIVQSGGALVSEFEPDFRATPYSFPQRNRIMAGIARGVLIIEAGERSGTLVTARLATEYNRDVFVVPGPIFSANSAGANQLLKLGATPVTSGKDILTAWNMDSAADGTAETPGVPHDCTEVERTLLELLDEPMTKDDLIRESGLSITDVNIGLSTLELRGLTKEALGEVHRAI